MGVQFFTLKGGKQMMEFMSERVVNISDLEKILTDIFLLSQIAQNSSCDDDKQKLLCKIERLADQAAHFEFHLESRITTITNE